MLKAILCLFISGPAFAQLALPSLTADRPTPLRGKTVEYMPWYVNFGLSQWVMGYRQGQNYRATTGQAGYRFNRTVATEIESTFGHARYQEEDLRQNIYSLAMALTPVSVMAFGWNFFEVAILPGGSYFDTIDYWAGFAAGRVSLAVNPNFAIIGQYRKYIGMYDVARSGYDVYSANPEDFTTLAASMRF